jgi:hypothetical protein
LGANSPGSGYFRGGKRLISPKFNYRLKHIM